MSNCDGCRECGCFLLLENACRFTTVGCIFGAVLCSDRVYSKHTLK